MTSNEAGRSQSDQMMGESATTTATKEMEQKSEHFDVLIVGAGISGVGAAYHLT